MLKVYLQTEEHMSE